MTEQEQTQTPAIDRAIELSEQIIIGFIKAKKPKSASKIQGDALIAFTEEELGISREEITATGMAALDEINAMLGGLKQKLAPLGEKIDAAWYEINPPRKQTKIKTPPSRVKKWLMQKTAEAK